MSRRAQILSGPNEAQLRLMLSDEELIRYAGEGSGAMHLPPIQAARLWHLWDRVANEVSPGASAERVRELAPVEQPATEAA